jgi:ATP-dependent RNA helicase DOB1
MESIKEQLCEVCYEWCNGANFAQLCKMTDTYEGSIIRTLRRLNELLKQMASASNIIGNDELANRFN